MNYDALIATLAQVHQQAHAGAAGTVSRHLILRNWLIGAYLVEFEQNGEDRAKYGSRLLNRVSADLRKREVPGTSPDMLERMRLFYHLYPQLADRISAPLVRKLPFELPVGDLPISATPARKSASHAPTPLSVHALFRFSWSHFVELIRLNVPWKRALYWPFITPSAARGKWRRAFRAEGCFANRKAGGFTACSRWSSVATPPDNRSPNIRTPAGVLAVDQHEP